MQKGGFDLKKKCAASIVFRFSTGCLKWIAAKKVVKGAENMHV